MEEMEEIKDYIILQKEILKITKEHRKYIEEVINVKTARIMDKLKTEEGKNKLAEMTQKNYKTMIELDVMILQLEKTLKLTEVLFELGE